MRMDKLMVKVRRWALAARYGFWVPPYDGMMDERRCRFLYDMILGFKGPKHVVLEIGSFKGCSTTWLAMAARRAGFPSVVAVDLFTGTPSWGEKWDTYSEFMHRMKRNRLTNFVIPKKGDAGMVARGFDSTMRISILHIDGDHAYEAVSADIMNYVPFLDASGILILDDHDSAHPGVLKAGRELMEKGFEVVASVPERDGKGGSVALCSARRRA